MDLKNKVVIITGASDGLGRSLAIKIAENGAKVALVSRSEEKLKAVKKEIGSAGEYFVCDIGQPNQVKTTVKTIVEKFGSIDILVNNAGIWLQGKTEEVNQEKIQAVYNANILGLIYMTQAVLPILKTRSEATIFNVVSDSGIDPAADWGIYVGSKFAARGFTQSLRLELADTNIKVMAIFPGGMDTDLFVKAGNQLKNEPWMMNREEVAEVILFMLTRPKNIVIQELLVRKFFGK